MKKKDSQSEKISPYQVRRELRKFIQMEIEKLPTTIEQVSPEKRIEFLSKVIPMITGKDDDFNELATWYQ